VTAVLQLQDGDVNLGTVSQSFALGTLTTATTSFANTNTVTIPGQRHEGQGFGLSVRDFRRGSDWGRFKSHCQLERLESHIS